MVVPAGASFFLPAFRLTPLRHDLSCVFFVVMMGSRTVNGGDTNSWLDAYFVRSDTWSCISVHGCFCADAAISATLFQSVTAPVIGGEITPFSSLWYV